MVVGARRVILSISQSAQLMGFSRTTISRVYKECKYGKNVGENALLMLKIRMVRLIQAD